MKRLILSLTFFALLFLAQSALFSNNALAIPDPPQLIGSTPFCTENDEARIQFEFRFELDLDSYEYYFWRTGLNDERYVTTGKIIEDVSADPLGTTYDWYVKVCDKEQFPNPCIGCGCSEPTYSNTDPERPDCSQPDPEPEPTYDCTNRPPECPVSIYPFCNEYTQGEGRNPCTGTDPAYCDFANENRIGSPTYCSYYERVNCSNEGVSCTGNAGTQGTCCNGLICDKPGGDATQGVCRDPGGTPSDPNTCIKCPEGYKWDETRCKNSSGDTTSGAQVTCGSNLDCKMGEGCVEKPVGSIKCTANSDCFSGVCNKDEGVCEAGLIPLVCSQNANNSFTCKTAIGTFNADPESFSRSILRLILGLAGGLLLILIIFNGYKLMTSQGDPEKVKDAREGIIAAIAGVLLIIFALSILQLITVDIIGIPGFS